MNIYEKVQRIKLELLESKFKKSGENKFAGFKYYELGDFLPQIIKLCDKHKVCTQVNFEENSASLMIVDSEDSNGFIEVSTPTEKLQIKGSNAIQALGGMQTYMRRYLYMAMFDITESDMFDAVSGKEDLRSYCCHDCGQPFEVAEMDGQKLTKKQVYNKLVSKYGKARCKTCREKLNNKGEI